MEERGLRQWKEMGGGEVGSGCRAGTLIGVSNYGLMLKSN